MVDQYGAHWYYASRGLSGAVDLGERWVDMAGALPDYAGQYYNIWWLDAPPEHALRPYVSSWREPSHWWKKSEPP